MSFSALVAAAPYIASAVGSVAGGLLSHYSAKDSNEKSLQAQQMEIDFGRETNALQVAEAQKNRDFQAIMSNTAHTREVRDLRRAGLNPILSATGGNGASTPSGGIANVDNPGAGMTANSINSAKVKQEAINQQIAIGKAFAETIAIKSQADLNQQKIKESQQSVENLKAQEIKTEKESWQISENTENTLVARQGLSLDNIQKRLNNEFNDLKILNTTAQTQSYQSQAAHYQQLMNKVIQDIKAGKSYADVKSIIGEIDAYADTVQKVGDAIPLKNLLDNLQKAIKLKFK